VEHKSTHWLHTAYTCHRFITASSGQAFVAVFTDVHRVTVMRNEYHRNAYRKDAHRSYFAVLTLKTPGDLGQPGERLSSG